MLLHLFGPTQHLSAELELRIKHVSPLRRALRPRQLLLDGFHLDVRGVDRVLVRLVRTMQRCLHGLGGDGRQLFLQFHGAGGICQFHFQMQDVELATLQFFLTERSVILGQVHGIQLLQGHVCLQGLDFLQQRLCLKRLVARFVH